MNNNHDPGEDTGGYKTAAYRLQLLWEPNDKFSGLFKVHGWEVSDGTARIFRANVFNAGSSNLVDGFEQDQVWLNGLNTQEITSRGGLLRLSYDLGSATLTSITGYESIRDMYSRGDIDGGTPDGPGFIPFQVESAGAMPKLDQWTQEFRIASNGGGAVNWLAGFFYFNEEVTIDNFGYASVPPDYPQFVWAQQFQEATAYAIFGSLNWAVSDSWDLAGGLRFSDDDKDFWVAMPQELFPGQLDEPITRYLEDSFTSWDLSATYKASQDVNIYGRLSQGFRAPSIQGRISFCNVPEECVTTADTESNLSFEVGVKSILAQNKLRLNLAAYIFEMSDQQLTAVGGEFNTATLLNADKTKGHGIEADIEWVPSGNFFMTFGASWNPTEIVDADLTVAPCGGGCTVTDPVIDGLAYINGNSLPHAPEYIVNGIINFQSDPVKKNFFGSLDFAYHSEKHFFLYDSVEFNSSSFELGMRLGYAFANAKYEVALFGRNLLDAEIVRNGIDFNNLTGMMNDPRIVGIEFLAKF
ncbi:MAG: TonB-dependent receptor [Acidobacteria bacterium]|nr:TonB-dependent receptor [Candidatus Sulfomarinibacter sp. MAG AM2]